MEEEDVCQTCQEFEPQAWRKSLCRNCFHTLEEHSEELLKAEGEAVEKEKAEAAAKKAEEKSSSPADKSSKISEKIAALKRKDSLDKDVAGKPGKDSKDVSGKTGKDSKDTSGKTGPDSKDVSQKRGSIGAAGKEIPGKLDSGKTSWGQDLGREYGKSPKAESPKAGSLLKGKLGTSSGSPTSSTSSTSPSPKSSPSALKTSAASSSSSATTLTSRSSTASAATKTTTSSSFSSSSSPSSSTSKTAQKSTGTTTTTTTTTTATTTATTSTTSKAKSLTSKFEAKASESTAKDKPASKPADLRLSSSSVSAISGKLAGDSKASPLDSKAIDSKTASSTKSQESKSPASKQSDSKTAEGLKSPSPKPSESKSLGIKSGDSKDGESSTAISSKLKDSKSFLSKSKEDVKKEDTKKEDVKKEEVKKEEVKKEDAKKDGMKTDDKVAVTEKSAGGAELKDKKSSLLSSKFGDKDSRFSSSSNRSKAAPFGKDMLKSTKDTAKKDTKPPDSSLSKANGSKTKDTSSAEKSSAEEKSPVGKSKDNVSGKASTSKTPSWREAKEEKDKALSASSKPPSSTAASASSASDDKTAKKTAEDSTIKSCNKTTGSDGGQSTGAEESKLVESGYASSSSPTSPSASLSHPLGSKHEEKAEAGDGSKAGHGAKSNSVTQGALTGKADTRRWGKAGDATEEDAGKTAIDNDKKEEKKKDKEKEEGEKGKKSTVDDVTEGRPNKAVESAGAPWRTKAEREKDTALKDSGQEKEARGVTASEREKERVAGVSSSTSSVSSSSSPASTTTASSASTSLSDSSSKCKNNNKLKDSKSEKDAKGSSSVLGKFKDLEKNKDIKSTPSSFSLKSSKTSSPKSSSSSLDDGAKSKETTSETNDKKEEDNDKNLSEKLKKDLKEKEEKVADLALQVTVMEKKMKKLEEEKETLQKNSSLQNQKEDMEKLLQDLRSQLGKMESQCSRLETDNKSLLEKLREQEENVKREQKAHGKTQENEDLERDLELTEKELEEVKDENDELKRQVMEMKNEMDEMYDTFRENEHDEFREIQKELDMTAKNCRILQFKLRKAERRNEQIEEDRIHYEEKLRHLQDQFDSQDAKNHIRVLEEELRIAKEVSVRLHDELDIIEDKRTKAMEENRHLTELLEHTDKRQFRMEMEIDKLRDLVADLKMELREAKSGSNATPNNKDSPSDHKAPTLGTIGKQGSKEYDVSQLMKDLCDCMERENDLKDQLKFTEEEAKMMRRKVSEMDEENENLRVQLQKMSEKASKHKKKEKETQKALDEERRLSEANRTGSGQSGVRVLGESDETVLIVGADGSDVIMTEDPVMVSRRKDSTDEDLMNVMQMRIQMEILEQELMMSQKKLNETDMESENLQAEVKFLQEKLEEKNQESLMPPEPSTPNAYYEDKIKEMTQEIDELRWKLIEKDRELERISVIQTHGSCRQGREQKKKEKLKKSKSLDTASDPSVTDLRKQLDQSQVDVIRWKQKVEELNAELDEFRNRTPVPSVQADDAAVENIELRDRVKKLEEENKTQVEKMKGMAENLQRLSRDTRTFKSIATSPTAPGTRHIPGILLPVSGSLSLRAVSASANEQEGSGSCDLGAQLRVLQDENLELRRAMAEADAKVKSVGSGTAATDSTDVVGHSGGTALESHTSTGDVKAATSEKQDGAKTAVTTTTTTTTTTTGSTTEMSGHQATDAKKGSEGDGESGKQKKKSEDGQKEKSILSDYPDGKSKVVVTGEESRVELMEKILDMDEEICELIRSFRKKEEESTRLARDIKVLKVQIQEVKDESRRTELDLLQELDMLHDKNSVMSNLLDIINERAEAAEEELERRIQEDSSPSPARSESNVSQVSALSDTSIGSDEVFPVTGHVTKDGVVTRDWESKLKTRIESLERLLAEERQKVATAEKKLFLSGVDSVAPSVSDDVKLRLREKELLQEELIESQRHLHIAADQIKGLRERLHTIEEEHTRLKLEYEKLYVEIDKPLDAEKDEEEDEEGASTTDSDKTPENTVDNELPFVAKKISVVEAPKYNALKQTVPDTCDVTSIENELAEYKRRAKELEYKIEEINDIWRSKSTASDKEKDELDLQHTQKVKELLLAEETMENLKRELCTKDKTLAEMEVALREKENALSRKSETMRDQENESRRLEQDHQTLITQISQRDGTIRGLNETIRIRDERLREKDDILFKLNQKIDEKKRDLDEMEEKVREFSSQLSEKDAVISVLRGQISNASGWSREESRACETDAEKESVHLREVVATLRSEVEVGVKERKTQEENLETSRRALDEAMLQWSKERNALQREVNILEEKIRLYEDYSGLGRNEAVDGLKQDVQNYFREKEDLLCELSTLRMRHESAERAHKEQVAKLQSELSDKLRLLKVEVDNNTHLTTELDRLTRQAETAYRLQQEERMMRAEHLAMKVRYETRLEKMSKEFNKMLLTLDKVKKERDMNQEILQAVQKNLSCMKDRYTEELLRADEDKTALDRQLKEIEEARVNTDSLQKLVRELREQTLDQERLRAELINKMATDRASWEMERANLNSQLNQLEEQMSSTCRQQARTKDIQVNMGMAWDKERREQRRLLSEAHTLALDLQEQLRSRDEAFAHERKELIRQMEGDRLNFTKEKREIEKKVMEMESAGRKVTSLQKRMKEVQEKTERDNELWQKEKNDLLRLLSEARQAHSQDTKRMEDVLSGLIRLRELGALLSTPPGPDSSKASQLQQRGELDQNILSYVKEAVCQISQAADALSMTANTSRGETVRRKSASNSEINLLKDELSELRHEANDVVLASNASATQNSLEKSKPGKVKDGAGAKPEGRGSHTPSSSPSRGGDGALPTFPAPHHPHPHHHPVATSVTPKTSAEVSSSAFSSTSAFSPSSSSSSSTATSSSSFQASKTRPSTVTPTPVILRPFDSLTRRFERPPSYTSGTRSASTSRATTPETPEAAETSPFRKSGLPEPPPSLVIPHHAAGASKPKQSYRKALTSALSSAIASNRPKRPVTFTKSLSVDSSDVMDYSHSSRIGDDQVSGVTSISANNTPTQPMTTAEPMTSYSTSGSMLSPASADPCSTSPSSSSRYKDKCSPRTARKRFFEAPPILSPYPMGYQSWPERRSVSPASHVRQTSLPDPKDVRREAEVEHQHITTKHDSGAMKTSTSWDEKMHRGFAPEETSDDSRVMSASTATTVAQAAPPGAEATADTPAAATAATTTQASAPTTTSAASSSGKTAKDKRKLFFKKSGSLDSTVGNTIAKVGVSAMPPAAPSGFTPSDLFAAVKGKLKPVFKRKSGDFGGKGQEPRPPSPLFIPTEVPEYSIASSGATSLPVPVPHADVEGLEKETEEARETEPVSELPSARSRDNRRLPPPFPKWRSKSADRAAPPPSSDADVTSAANVWKFNETAV